MQEETLLRTAMVLYLVAVLAYLVRFATQQQAAGKVATVAAWLGVLAQTALLVMRGISARHVPLVSMYEYLSAFAWMVALAYLIYEWRAANTAEGVQAAGGPAMLLAVALLGYASTLPLEMKEVGPLMPVLKSNWLIFHVSVAVLAYGAAGLASALACLYFLRWTSGDKALVWRIAASTTVIGSVFAYLFKSVLIGRPLVLVGAVALLAVSGAFATIARWLPSLLATIHRWLCDRTPSEVVLDRAIYRAVRFAFPFLTLVNVTGAVWAYSAWGRYWGWDPKETWSLITWMIYTFYLHARLRAGWRPAQVNAVVMVGIIAILFTFLGVNQLAAFSESLHSYR
jgi:cytochrome c-type biogenesis protein CcsB